MLRARTPTTANPGMTHLIRQPSQALHPRTVEHMSKTILLTQAAFASLNIVDGAHGQHSDDEFLALTGSATKHACNGRAAGDSARAAQNRGGIDVPAPRRMLCGHRCCCAFSRHTAHACHT